MRKLDAYLRTSRLTSAAFARELGVSQATVSRLRDGKQTPSLSLAAKIRNATKGAVTADDFLDAQPEARAS